MLILDLIINLTFHVLKLRGPISDQEMVPQSIGATPYFKKIKDEWGMKTHSTDLFGRDPRSIGDN